MSTIVNCINNIFPSVSLTPVYFAVVTLTSFQLNNMSTTVAQLIAAPGSNLANIPTQMTSYSSTGTGGSGSSVVSVTNGAASVISISTPFLGLAGTSVMNTSTITVSGATNGAYTNINNVTTCLFGGTVTGTTQTCSVLVHYFITPLV